MEPRLVILRIASLLLASFALTACGLAAFVDPKTNPVIINYAGLLTSEKTIAYALTSERRMVLIQAKKNGRSCAEPSPDAAENVASQIRLALQAKVSEPKIDVSGQLDFAKELLTAVQQLFRRSQGIQLFRDGAFALCQQYLNAVLQEGEYKQELSQLLDTAAKLIELEIKKTGGVIGGPPPAVLPILPPGADDKLRGEVAGSDFVRALGLVTTAKRNLGETGEQPRVNAEVALKQLFVEILKPNATAMTSKSGPSDQSGADAKKDIKTEKPTLSSSQFRAILDEVRKLARVSEQKTLAIAEDIVKIGDADAFVAKFS